MTQQAQPTPGPEAGPEAGPVAGMERHQVAIYVGAIASGAVAGWAGPGLGPVLEHAINPVLAALLYVTFLQVPAAELVRALRAGRFLVAALVVNFIVVLLTPCVDYVIVFSGLAGGDARRLLAATPLLLLAQMIALPVLLVAFMGEQLRRIVEPGPFVEAFLVLIVIPLALAWLTQAWAARRPAGRAVVGVAGAAMVPLMAVTLITVVASQVPKLDGNLAAVAAVVPFYVLFLAVMAAAGLAVARLFRLDAPAGRAIVFTGATRNSLVVLPLALALPDALAIAAAVVIAQTLVEVMGMVVYVRLVPRLLPLR
ncbi:arsenic resistance protein [Nonomuraea sp. NPDC050451]|uniref:arsenic resistance protein n=1 Tax=Nonomuraea sp. NPDC050451 TaxID=3364364 RepID=UPI0037B12C94